MFTDHKKAYNNIALIKLWKVFEETGICHTLIAIVKELYSKSLSYIKQGGLLSEGFEVTKGLRQGCCISSTLFKIYVEEALNIWKRKCSGMGYNVDNKIYTPQFADDQLALAQSKDDLEYMCQKLQEEYSKWGLTINIAKTKFMSLGTDINRLEMDNGDIITGCTECRYRASVFTKDGRDTKNKHHRVAQARKIIGALNGIRWSKDNKKLKKDDL